MTYSCICVHEGPPKTQDGSLHSNQGHHTQIPEGSGRELVLLGAPLCLGLFQLRRLRRAAGHSLVFSFLDFFTLFILPNILNKYYITKRGVLRVRRLISLKDQPAREPSDLPQQASRARQNCNTGLVVEFFAT